MAQTTLQEIQAPVYLVAASAFSECLRTVGGFFRSVRVANSKVLELQRLSELTNAKLAYRHGIRRCDVVAYVFKELPSH